MADPLVDEWVAKTASCRVENLAGRLVDKLECGMAAKMETLKAQMMAS